MHELLYMYRGPYGTSRLVIPDNVNTILVLKIVITTTECHSWLTKWKGIHINGILAVESLLYSLRNNSPDHNKAQFHIMRSTVRVAPYTPIYMLPYPQESWKIWGAGLRGLPSTNAPPTLLVNPIH